MVYIRQSTEDTYLEHHGIKGQRWGVRRYQNEDGSLTEAGRKHMAKKDERWARKNADKIEKKAYKQSIKEMRKVTRQLNRKYGFRGDTANAGRRYMNEYNQKLAEVMNTKVSDIASPSGRAVKFVAKRGDYGVYFALADQGYDMSKVQSGVWNDGRVAYKKETIKKS